MTNPQPQSDPLTPESETTPPPPTTPSSQPARRNWFPLFIVLAVLGITACVCVGLCTATFGTSLYKSVAEKDNIEQVLDQLLTAMESKDSQTAYSLFSSRAQKQWGVGDLDKLLEGNNYVLFKNYSSISIQNLNISTAINSNPDAPQGTIANVSAIVSYDDGFEGQITAILEQEGDQWRLFAFNIVVPPDKLTQGDSAFN